MTSPLSVPNPSRPAARPALRPVGAAIGGAAIGGAAVGGTELDAAIAGLEWTLLDFRRTELRERVGLRLPRGLMRFHWVVSGAVDVIGVGAPVRLAAGDFILVDSAEPYEIRAQEPALVDSGDLACGPYSRNALARIMPGVLVACGFTTREPHMVSLLEGLRQETASGEPSLAGSRAIASRFASLITAAAVRSWVLAGCAPASWSLAVRDQHIARAIGAMRDDPGASWSLDDLARIAQSSRSAFVERFREVTGDSPGRFLTTLRMERAERLLRVENLGVGETATMLGYGSNAAFSRAFRRHVGESPVSWLRRTGSR
ncbi:helix-turn-helix domain-containing protein [Compostimonas suwonensis]|uniref:helix-turn-helix domain-containing protein n=1 Tax=Compostimonas suwonensis TaxID=1048394 RepID=UPI0014766AA8|nr:AraC family transcriptional regulator [Compostimonas suwonensis]